MIPSAQRTATYAGTGSATAFVYPYYFINSADLVVSTKNLGLQVFGVNYTLNPYPPADGQGATINFVVAPANGDIITVTRTVPLTQLSQLRPTGPFSPAVVENMVDRCVMAEQQLQDEITVLQNAVNPGGGGVLSQVALFNGSANQHGGVKMWDPTLNQWMYLYVDNGVLKVDNAVPT